MRLVKVVRDKIVTYLHGEGGLDSHTRVTYGQINTEDLARELRKKLIEEAAEYAVEPCVDELADVLEVCHALATIDLNMQQREVEHVRLAKKAERGGFTHGLGMWCGEIEPEDIK